MFKIHIYSEKHGYFWLEMENQQQLDAYIEWCKESEHWGVEEKQIVDEADSSKIQIIKATYRIEIEDIRVQKEQEKLNIESEKFLRETDWLVLRELEGGRKMPQEIKQRRQKARDHIKRS